MSNKEIYQMIHEEIKQNPSLKQATICRKHGASYGGYRYWLDREGKLTPGNGKTTKTSSEQGKGPSVPNNSITVDVSIDALASAYVMGREVIELPLMDVIAKLSPEKLRELLGVLASRKKGM